MEVTSERDKARGRTSYKILDDRTKEFLIKQTDYLPFNRVSKIYGVSINNLKRWKMGIKRKEGAGRKIVSVQLESQLIDWISREIEKNGGVRLTRRLIQKKAKDWSTDSSFKASKGWFQRFSNRNRFLKLQEILEVKRKVFKTKEEDNSAVGSCKPGPSSNLKPATKPKQTRSLVHSVVMP